MFTTVTLEQAIEYWKKGREVIILDRHAKNENGGYATCGFAEPFQDVELLADVPAVENPEFNQAVADMIQSEEKQEELPEEKSSAPPNEAGGEGASGQERKRKSGEGQADGSEGSDHCGDC